MLWAISLAKVGAERLQRQELQTHFQRTNRSRAWLPILYSQSPSIAVVMRCQCWSRIGRLLAALCWFQRVWMVVGYVNHLASWFSCYWDFNWEIFCVKVLKVVIRFGLDLPMHLCQLCLRQWKPDTGISHWCSWWERTISAWRLLLAPLLLFL